MIPVIVCVDVTKNTKTHILCHIPQVKLHYHFLYIIWFYKIFILFGYPDL